MSLAARPWTRSSVLALSGVAALALALVPRAVFLGQAFFERDVHLDAYAHAVVLRRVVAQGSWPLWNPWAAFGQPLLASGNTQAAYPITWLLLVLPAEVAYTVSVVIHLVVLGAGALCLGRRLGLGWTAAFGGAAVVVLAGPFVSLVNLWNHFAAAAWLPWLAVGADASLERPRPLRLLGWGAVAALMVLAGSPDMAALGALLCAALAVERAATGRVAARTALLAGAAAAAWALALSAVQWIPAMALARAGARASLDAGARAFWSIHPASLLELAWPLVMDRLALRPEVRDALFSGREAFLRSPYLGLTTVPLVAVALAARRRPMRVATLVAGLAALAFALGPHTPAFSIMARLPMLDMLRFPAKALVLVALCWALLAAMGLEAWSRGPDPSPRAWRAVAAGSLALAFVTAGAALVAHVRPDTVGRRLFERDPGYIASLKIGGVDVETASMAPTHAELLRAVARRLAVSAALLAAVGVLAGRRRARAADPAGAVAVALLGIADLLAVHSGLHPVASPALLTAEPAAVAALRTADGSRTWAHDYFTGWNPAWGPAPRNLPLPESWPSSVVRAAVLHSYVHPAVAAAWGLEGSFEADRVFMSPRHVTRLTAALHEREGTPAMVKLFQVAGVGRAAALHTAGFEGLVPASAAPCLLDRPALVFDVPGRRPRTYAVAQARVAADDQVVETLLSPGFDPGEAVLIADGEELPGPPGAAGSSRIVEKAPDRVTMAADLHARGYVVLLDAFDPGWTVEVDGRPAVLRRANGAFRAVLVEAGRHDVVMKYRPRPVLVGAAVSAAAALAALAVVVVARRPGEGRIGPS